ncbi:hypothetical protein [Gilvimarinus xylanilyticus]|uniref:Uncharacterized protein n=1 Tax=Gilvimarinus xylanilyticus TaxID=2944139 RepID=A0A9X2HYJ2_9GAMM|nr:hypothetical protein [Gilvimarinus xylanilyticus]MCP8900079.1 hypothetical protein [Gilvimarinus xylanilyticus]
MDGVRATDIDDGIFDVAPAPGRHFRVWTVVLAISILAHLLLGWLWSLYELKPIPETNTVTLKVKMKRMEVSAPVRVSDNPATTPSVIQHTEQDAPKSPVKARQTQTAPSEPNPVRTTIKPAQAEPINTQHPISTSPSPASNPSTQSVFDPRLQAKLNRAGGAARAAPSATFYTDISGSTRLELGEGKCLRSKVEDKRGFTTNWYLTGCNQQQSEGDKIIQALERRLKR